MKKYIIIILLIVFITPFIASASWWNPFSWKIFNSTNNKEVSTQIQKNIQPQEPENKIKEKKTIEGLVDIDNQLSSPSNDEVKNKNKEIVLLKEKEKTINEIDNEKDSIKEIFNNQIKSCKEGNIEKFYSYLFYGDKTLKNRIEQKKQMELELTKINKEDINTYNMIKNIISELNFLPSYCNNITYSFGDIKISNNTATLIINATINGQEKFPKIFYYIKDNNIWKQNQFGYNHPADGIVSDPDQSNQICISKDHSISGNMYNEETKEVFCFHDEPTTKDLLSLNINECEERTKNYRDSCYIPYAEYSKDENYCKKVSIMNRQDCFNRLAAIKKDINVCKNLWKDKTCLSNAKK